MPEVTAPSEGAPPLQPSASGSDAAPAMNSRREGRISLLYASGAKTEAEISAVESDEKVSPLSLVLAVPGLGKHPVERGALGGGQVLEQPVLRRHVLPARDLADRFLDELRPRERHVLVDVVE